MQTRDPCSPGQTPLQARTTDQEMSDANFELENITEVYHKSSRSSMSDSLVPSSTLRSPSQTFFTANGNKDDDTTSFYLALQDGFSLSQCDTHSRNAGHGGEFLWSNVDSNGTDMMLPLSNFQVFWNDVSYRIEPKITFGRLWSEIEQIFKSSLSTIPHLIGCNHVQSYDLKNSRRENEALTILQEIGGSFQSGKLTAIMGPSGAGKTSLINFLARQREKGYSGQLYLDGPVRRVEINTIPQSDRLPQYLNVRESLMFASRLKNSGLVNHDHDKNIEKVSALLGLEHCLETRAKKISNGELKRLAIAQELLSKPGILILDEPTSGLDSLTCYKTISALKGITKAASRGVIEPIAIVLTIHQPEQEVFDLFDKVYVMASGGVTIYNGPPRECVRFIEKYAGIQMPDKDYNPALFLIEIASGEYGEEPIKALAGQVKLKFVESKASISSPNAILTKQVQVDDYDQEKRFSINQDTIIESDDKFRKLSTPDETRIKPANFIDQRLAKGSSVSKGNFLTSVRILTKRCYISAKRSPKLVTARLLFILVPTMLTLLIKTLPGKSNGCPQYYAEYKLNSLIKDDNQISAQVQEQFLLTFDNMGLLLIIIYSTTCASIGATTLSFTLDLQSSIKEFYNGWYSIPSYMIARMIAEIPLQIILPTLTVAIAFPLTGQLQAYDMLDLYRVFVSALGAILGSMVGETMGMIFGTIYVGHVSTALFVSQGATLPLILISGFVVRTKNMSTFVYLLSYLSYFRHSLEVAIIARYGFNICKCDPKAIIGTDAKIVGVPEKLKSFTQYYFDQFSSPPEETSTTIADSSSIVINGTEGAENDIFQMFATQISLFNSNGIVVRSCSDVKPIALHVSTIDEGDLNYCIISLITLLLAMKLILFVTVRLVLHSRVTMN